MSNPPEGPRPSLRWTGVCIDCADAEELADFYGRLLGWEETGRDGPGWIAMRDPGGGTGLLFQAERDYRAPVWPEQPGGQDKMLHFEIQVDDLDAAVAHAVASGARLAEYQPQPRVRGDARPGRPSLLPLPGLSRRSHAPLLNVRWMIPEKGKDPRQVGRCGPGAPVGVDAGPGRS